MELCPQGRCDLVEQVALSFSAALPSVPTAVLPLLLQRLSLSHHPLPDPSHAEEPSLHPAQHFLLVWFTINAPTKHSWPGKPALGSHTCQENDEG